MVGVVGGLGPYAGLDLVRKVFDATPARRDQDHLPLAMVSVPDRVGDRTAFLLGRTGENPGHAIGAVVRQLAAVGAEVVGVPCNTVHAPVIFDPVRAAADAAGVELVDMVEEAAADLAHRFPTARRVGVLGTTGTRAAGTYPQALAAVGVEAVELADAEHEWLVQAALYNPDYGVKAFSNPVTARAVRDLREAVGRLADAGAEAVVLACTEIPLALAGDEGVPLVDATDALARALVRRSLGAAGPDGTAVASAGPPPPAAAP
jgi:aspartate racemase